MRVAGRCPLVALPVSVVPLVLVVLLALTSPAAAQVSAAISGVVTDASGAAMSAATVTARNLETAGVRTTVTDSAGRYQLAELAVAAYDVTVAKDGFQTIVRGGIRLVVGQHARVDASLRVGAVTEQITVTGDVPPVTVTTADISGLVGEQQVKNLPLNGRSYDLLMLLNPGVVNFTWEKTGGIGISNSTTANMFAVSGNRPQQNLFLLNGVEFTGAAENNMTPGGASGQLLGIDAVREFNILRDTYGAEYGKKPGGQITIVTRSGTNQFHGSMFEFLRNSALDAPNYFDAGPNPPPFQRNQFGASGGGPIVKDKTFVFANYEGFAQNLNQTSVAFVPDAQARLDAAPIIKTMGLLNLWPVAPAGAPDFKVTANGDGVAQVLSSPLQTIREHFGTVRLDHAMSSRDTLGAVYTIDDSNSVTATPFDPYSTDVLSLREQVLSVQHTHVFSSAMLNTARFGFSRAGYFFTGEPTPGTPAASVSGFLAGLPVGAVVVGGSQASNPQAQLGLAGSNNGSNLHITRNLFSLSDDVAFSRGQHQIRVGAWLQPFQSNEVIALSQYGQLTFTGLPNFLAGTASFLYDPAPTPMQWRSLFGALYAEDVMRVRSDLTISLGFRGEFSTGWNEANGQAANYALGSSGPVCASQPASNVCLPQVGSSLLSMNRSAFLPQPRIGIAWRPFDEKTVVRASAGVYNDLQDALGYRADQNAPFNPTYTIGATGLTNIFGARGSPIQPGAAPTKTPLALLLPGGVQPDLSTPTLVSYSARVERALSSNTSLSVGYVGSHGYHEIIGVDANAPAPVVCPASPCPATFPTTLDPTSGQPVYGALAGTPVPAGTYFNPTATKPNTALANTWTWVSEGRSTYNALQLDLNRRFNGGLSLRGVYTVSKAMDDGDSLNATAASNAVALLSNPYNPIADWGPATYDVRHAGSVNVIYALPFGRGGRMLSGFGGVANELVSGWMLNSIVSLQSGFPLTPQLAYNPANNGDSRNPVRPFLNPAFSGSVVTGNPNQWFNPNAFIAPPSTSGFYGNVGRNAYTGPGLATWDFSGLKDTRVGAKTTLQFRLEVFNLLNRANFNTPNLITHVLQAPPNGTFPEASPTAGQVTSTSTSSRQIQFGLKLLW
ncbi:MAG TPA: carboxypeptidase-like regulatory domain-containing protein [Vicinamibacterales bacterium]|nr:carboxypeptidase-like regulatory domain-containing protein [Vicinamibacterales bacterium]